MSRKLDIAVAAALGHTVFPFNNEYYIKTDAVRGTPVPHYSTELCHAWPLVAEARKRWRGKENQRLLDFLKELPIQPYNFKEDVLASAICSAFTQAAV